MSPVATQVLHILGPVLLGLSVSSMVCEEVCSVLSRGGEGKLAPPKTVQPLFYPEGGVGKLPPPKPSNFLPP